MKLSPITGSSIQYSELETLEAKELSVVSAVVTENIPRYVSKEQDYGPFNNSYTVGPTGDRASSIYLRSE